MNVVIPGTTPNWRARIQARAEDLDKVVLTFSHGGKKILEKTYTEFEDDTENGWSIFYVSLTQEETLLFKNGMAISIQCNAMLSDDRFATGVTQLVAATQLNREVI